MSPTLPSVILIIVLVIGIFLTLLIGWGYHRQSNICLTNESKACLNMMCPCGSDKSPPCYGFAHRPGPNVNTFYCSNSGPTLFDATGNIIN